MVPAVLKQVLGATRRSWALLPSGGVGRAMRWALDASLKIRDVPKTRPKESGNLRKEDAAYVRVIQRGQLLLLTRALPAARPQETAANKTRQGGAERTFWRLAQFDGYEHPEQIRVTYSDMDPHNFWTQNLAFCQ